MATGVMATMKFRQNLDPQELTWVESHARVGAVGLDVALTNLKTLANLRVQLLGAGVELLSLFVSDLEVWRDSRVDPGPVAFQSSAGPVYNPAFGARLRKRPDAADFGYSSCLVRLESAGSPLYRRSMWLSGNPDDAQGTIVRTPMGVPAWALAWTNFRFALAAPGAAGRIWGFAVKDRDPATTFEARISHIDGATGEMKVRGLNGAMTVGTLVILRNVRGLSPSPRGEHRIVARTDAGGVATVLLDGIGTLGGGPVLTGRYTRTGYMRKVVWSAVPYASADLIRFGSRRRGDSVDRAKGKTKKRPAVVR